MLNMHAADVTQPHSGMAPVCDAGHGVALRKDGGDIEAIALGEQRCFHDLDNLYRLRFRW